MKVAIFGGSGFVGDNLIDELLNQSHEVYALVRYGSEHKISNFNKIRSFIGDIDNPTAVEQTIINAEVVIYNIGIIREFKSRGINFNHLHFQGLKKCVDMSEKLNVKRFILMSANGVKDNGTGYQSTKYKAEEYLKNSSLNWTIFRPSLIFGDSKGKQEFCSQLKKDMLSLPFPAPLFFDGFNIFNAGKFEMSPIHVKDVSKMFVNSIALEKTYKKTYNLGGDNLTWTEILKLIATASEKDSKMFIPTPAIFIKFAASLFGGILPISRGQIIMLMEGNACDSKEVFQILDIKDPIKFNNENLDYLSNE